MVSTSSTSRIISAAFGAALGLTLPATAQADPKTETKMVSVAGIGLNNCDQWTAAREKVTIDITVPTKDEEFRQTMKSLQKDLTAARIAGQLDQKSDQETWVMGFVSAAALYTHNDYIAKLTLDGIFSRVSDTCKKQPTLSIMRALQSVLNDRHP